jgi:hypothetical protein
MKPNRVWCSEKTHCKHGHEFTADNTWLYDRGWKVERVCRECVRIRQDRAAKRKRTPDRGPKSF